ncbi:MAG TPA: hypothetical protein DCX19_00390 [Alphaproteobacteria bacterium]|nr:hypothetical protein [Alphaproteobacteria bacterium]
MIFLPREQVKSFHFTDRFYDEATKTAHLRYAFNDGAMTFEETITFENAPVLTDGKRREALDLCLRLLHFAAGVSYYKLYIPDEIKLDNDEMTRAEAAFFDLFYSAGLGEFSFRNNVAPRISFPRSDAARAKTADVRLKKGTVVPVGGGKDSIVSIESLKSAGFSPVLFSVGLPRPIRETMETSGLSSVLVRRRISPDLIAANEQARGALNGHVPVTGVIAFILMCAAVLYDFTDAVLSNERSANVGNTEKDGRVVNHQWSKSIEFERAFRALTRTVLPDFRYFSLLRPLSELAIAFLFSKIGKYDAVFTSCNKAFKLDERKRLDRWCADCDKCRFVFLALAPFMEKDRLVRVFGTDMLNDPAQIAGYRQLLGLDAFKPFECVGEIEESALALMALSDRAEWKNDAAVAALSPAVTAKYGNKKDFLIEKVFSLSDNHLIPEEYDDVVKFFDQQTRHGMGLWRRGTGG